MSVFSFKKLVKTQAYKVTFRNLLEQKSQHLKMKFLEYSQFNIQSYFTHRRFPTQNIMRIFSFETVCLSFGEILRAKKEVDSAHCAKATQTYKIFRNCDEIVQNVYSENVSDDCAMKLAQILELND